jgi:hypothetical protein
MEGVGGSRSPSGLRLDWKKNVRMDGFGRGRSMVS